MDYKKYYKGKKVLVTGGAGAVGSRLTRALLELGAIVIVLDDLSSAYEWNLPYNAGNLLFVKGDVASDIDLKRVFSEKPALVFHLAAFFANQNSIDYPERDLQTNGFGMLKILEYSAIYNRLERFVYSSSGCSIYGESKNFPLKEEDISMNLGTPYQVTKMLGELYCNYFAKQYGLKVVKARFFNSFGPGEVPGQYRNVIPNFIYRAMKGLPLTVTGDGKETRDFTYVGDIVDGLLRSGYFEEAVGEAFNFASGTETKIIDLANMVNKYTGNKSSIDFLERRKWDTKQRLLGSYEKAGKAIGYKPVMLFEKGLKSTIEWFRDNWDDIDASASFGPGMSSAVRGTSLKK
ncbi:MAG: NAD-dependent epimerase/dehydratase family protein [Sedimentisphaerales bacterium]|nr:NAD-dependent epimerase/dehydratase family protein [Sedimentisphaerales bacterium]